MYNAVNLIKIFLLNWFFLHFHVSHFQSPHCNERENANNFLYLNGIKTVKKQKLYCRSTWNNDTKIRKKISNLAVIGDNWRHIISLRAYVLISEAK